METASIQDGRPRTVVWTNDMLGQVIRRSEKDNQAGGDPHEIWHRMSGRQMGYVGNNGNYDVTYAAARGFRQSPGSPGPGSFADFDLAHDHINSYEQGARGGVYTAHAGDTLSGIAANLWGDASLWYKIAEVNGLTAESVLIEGQPLLIPTGVQRNENNANTFQPYDPLEVLGNTSPTSPTPNNVKECGVAGQVILAVLVYAVAVYVNPYLANVVQQGVMMATGHQEEFSWEQFAVATITAGITSYVSPWVSASVSSATGSAIAGSAAGAAASSAVSQGVSMALGIQEKFSWAAVAGAAAGAAAGEWAMPTAALKNIADKFGAESSQFASASFIRASANGVANAATRSLMNNGDFGDNMLAALPDVIGQTIGEGIAGALSGRSGQMSQGEHRSRTDKYNAALDGGATPDQLQALAHDLGLDGANVPMWRGGRSAPIEVGMLPDLPGYPTNPASVLNSFFGGLGQNDIVDTASLTQYFADQGGLARIGPMMGGGGFNTNWGLVVTPAALEMLRQQASGAVARSAGGAALSGGGLITALELTTAIGIPTVMIAAGAGATYVGIDHAAGVYERFASGGRVGPDGTAVVVAPFGGGHEAPIFPPLQLRPTRNPHEESIAEFMRERGWSEAAIDVHLRYAREYRGVNIDDVTAQQLRNSPGTAYISGDPPPMILNRWLRGTDGNVGIVPAQVAERLVGQRFENFDAFRETFWKTVADIPELANQFTVQNRADMRNGYAPVAPESQHYGAHISYILHHKTPIQHGGGVYDMSNILIVSPRYHQDVLDPSYHYGQSERRP